MSNLQVASPDFDLTVPAPADASEQDQYMAAQAVSFRAEADGSPRWDVTVVGTAHLEVEPWLVASDPSVFPGLRTGGTFGLVRARQCIGYLTGWVSTGEHSTSATGASPCRHAWWQNKDRARTTTRL